MAGKARVHELAKELGVESKTVLAKLQEIGEYVKSASSTVEAPVARRLREAMVASAAPAAAPRPATTRPMASRDCGEAGTAREGGGRRSSRTGSAPRRRS